MKHEKRSELLEYISNFPKWKIDALMLDDSDLRLRKIIEKYKTSISYKEVEE